MTDNLSKTDMLIARLLLSLLALAPFFALARPAAASQQARVRLEGTPVYAGPAETPDVLARLHEGDIIQVSDRNRDGWYKVQLPVPTENHKYGWVRMEDISRDAFVKDMDTAGMQRYIAEPFDPPRSVWTLLGFYDVLWVRVPQSQVSSGLAGSNLFAVTYGLEAGYRVTPDWTVSLSAGLHSYASYYAQGTLVGGIVEYTFSKHLPWKFGAALGAGASIGTTISGRVAGVQIVSEPFIAPAAVGKVTARWYAWHQFAIEGEAGLRYLVRSGIPLSVLNVDVLFLAPYMGGGLHVDF